MRPEQVWAQMAPRVARILSHRRKSLDSAQLRPTPSPPELPNRASDSPPVQAAESASSSSSDHQKGANDDYEAFMAEVEENEEAFNQKYVGDVDEATDSHSPEEEAEPAVSEEEDGDAEDLFEDMRYGVNPKNIARLEKNLVEARRWEMRGEVRGGQRPTDGLLTADLEFDRGLEPAPRPTPAVTAKIEDIIRLRVKDRLFDDRQPAIFDRQAINEQARLPALSTDKDRRGLAELYEGKYKSDVLGLDEGRQAQTTEELEMRELFRRICYSIDQMSRLSFTPVNASMQRPRPGDDPLVVDEKVGAVVTGDLLKQRKDYAEVFRPRRKELVSRSEMTPQERKSLRRRVKRINHIRAKKARTAERVRSGLTLGETRLLEKNLGRVQRQIAHSKVRPVGFTRQSDTFKNLAARQRTVE